MTSETTAKKNIQKLQRAIVDGLEDVKAQDIRVFDTEHLSPLFERVIVASGTSNRQTKALAASVRDAVREAGFPKPRTEGEDNGEWIIVDCGAAVVHVMQPAIRQYYQLEDIWGEKPVRLKLGAAKPAQPTKSRASSASPAVATSPNTKEGASSLRRASAAKTGMRQMEEQARAEKMAAKKAAPARKRSSTGMGAGSAGSRSTTSRSTSSRSAPKARVPTVVVGKPVARKTTAKKATTNKTSSPAKRSRSA